MSGDPDHRPDVINMGTWLQNLLSSFGLDTQSRDLGTQNVDGKDLPLPPAILGRLGDDPNKVTVLMYGHYDVQPVRRPREFTT